MAIEIEIKLRLEGEVGETRRKLSQLGFHVRKRRRFESNILFDNIKHSLRKDDKLLRLRQVDHQALLTFKGPSQPGRYKKRQEIETVLPDSSAVETILEQIGYRPVFRYEKFRTEYRTNSGGGMVLLDETPIGNFLELEGSPAWIDRTAGRLGFSTADYISRSYGYLYLAWCRERRVRPKNMVFKRGKKRGNP